MTSRDFQVDESRCAALGRVAVLMGGASAEREVSLKSGKAVLDALRNAGVAAHGVDVGSDLVKAVSDLDCDRAFVALHGRGGEDGTIQAILGQSGIPYTGSEVMASALAMDKLRTKYVLRGAGLPTPNFRLMTRADQAGEIFAALRPPLGVKPAREGSSIGVFRVETEQALRDAFDLAVEHDPMVLIEEWVSGPEYTVALLQGESLPVIGLSTEHTFYDYEAKYLSDDTRYLLPSGLDDEAERTVQRLARESFDILGCRTWGRVDIMQDPEGGFWILEVNTVPGMTDHSLVPMAARAAGISFPELVVRILEDTLESAS